MISMVVATWNRATLLHKTFQSMSLYTIPDEIIVVDDGGTDDTEDLCRAWRVRGRMPIVYVHNDNPGWSNRCLASNIGIKLAKHDEILFSDAETMFLSDVVHELRSARKRHPRDVVCAARSLRERYAGCPLHECDVTPGGATGLYRKDWLLAVGGWDETLPAPTGYDDADLHTRLAAAGHPQTKVPGVTTRHQWHELHPWNRGEDVPETNPNLTVLQSKEFPRDVVANVGREWGVVR